jgi:hypothetical protein
MAPVNNPYKNPDIQMISNGSSGESSGRQSQTMLCIFGGLCCCIFLPLVLVGFILILSAIGKVENGFENTFSNISASWKSDLIFGFTSNPSMVLPQGQYLAPWGGVWPGSNEGCNCPNSALLLGRRNVWPGLKAHSCSYNETYSGCQRVTGQSQVPLNKWGNGEQIFAIKFLQTNFLETYQQMDQNGNCAAGYKLCGNPASKSKGVCIKNIYSECPITQVSQTSRPGVDKPITLGSTTLYVSRDNSANPYSDVGVSEAFVCTARGLSSITPGRKRYQLLKGTTDTCQKDVDASYFSEIGEKNLFQVNQVPFAQLPEYEVDDKYKYVQWASRPLEWAPTCKDVVPNTQKLGDNIKTVADQAGTVKIFAIIAFIVALIAFGVQCAGVGIPSKIASGIALALAIIAIILVIPSVSTALKNGNNFSDTFDAVKSRQCSSDATNKQFDSMAGSFKSDFNGSLNTGMWVFIAGCVLQALFSVWALVTKNSDDENGALMNHQGW